MAIETLTDLNEQACCCGLTLCPVPAMECQSIEVSAEAVGHIDSSETVWKRFAQLDLDTSIVNSFSGGGLTVTGSSVEHYTQKFLSLCNLSIGAGCDYIAHEYEATCETSGSLTQSFTEPDPPPDDSYTQVTTRVQNSGTVPGEACTWTDTTVFNQTIDGVAQPEVVSDTDNTSISTIYSDYATLTDTQTYSDGVNYAQWIAHVSAKIAALVSFDYPGACIDAECSSAISAPSEDLTFPFNGPDFASAVKARVRFQIPSTWADQMTGATVAFTGTYFKFTYDILEEPDGWDDVTPIVYRSFFSEDNMFEWTGPGTGLADDPSWFTDWITLDPPSVPGTRRIVNVRFICRENWFVGSPPQVTGEAVTLPDP